MVCSRVAALILVASCGAWFAPELVAQMPPGSGEYLHGDHEAAYPLLVAAAKEGDPVAQFLVGQSYELAYGVLRNGREAERWYARARRPELPARLAAPAAGGDALAQTVLGICSEHGIGVEASRGDALTWYRRAAVQGIRRRRST